MTLALLAKMVILVDSRIEGLLEECLKVRGARPTQREISESVLEMFANVNSEQLVNALNKIYPGKAPQIIFIDPDTGKVYFKTIEGSSRPDSQNIENLGYVLSGGKYESRALRQRRIYGASS